MEKVKELTIILRGGGGLKINVPTKKTVKRGELYALLGMTEYVKNVLTAMLLAPKGGEDDASKENGQTQKKTN